MKNMQQPHYHHDPELNVHTIVKKELLFFVRHLEKWDILLFIILYIISNKLFVGNCIKFQSFLSLINLPYGLN